MTKELSVKQEVTIFRNCGKCKYQWSFKRELMSSSSDSFVQTDEKIYSDLKQNISTQKGALLLNPSMDIICPQCSFLAQETIDVFFKKGFSKGLKELHAAASKTSLTPILVVFASTFCISVMGYFFNSGFFSVFAMGFGLICIFFAVRFFIIVLFKAKIYSWLDCLSDNDALAVIVKICKKKNLIHPEIDWKLTKYYLKNKSKIENEESL